MARPLRRQWRIRTVVRRRHRTWMASMVLATFGWGAWWIALLLREISADSMPSYRVVYAISTLFAFPGLVLALLTLRARLIWVILAGVPLFANTSLLVFPPILKELEIFSRMEQESAPQGSMPAED